MGFFILSFYMFQNTSIGNDYCGEFDFNNPINTLLPIRSFDAIKLNITASSLTVAVTYKGDTVALIATQSGELKKVKPLNIYMFEKKTFFNTSQVLHKVIQTFDGILIHSIEGLKMLNIINQFNILLTLSMQMAICV